MKNILLTGGGGGIAKAIAPLLSADSYRLLLTTRAGDALASFCKEHSIQAEVLSADLTVQEEVEALFEWTNSFGGVDILINNAGVTRDALLMRMNEEQWDTVLQTNLKGAFHGMKAAIRPMMKKKSGRIINITSIVGLTGNAGQANYAASKSGLIGMSKSIAKEVATRGITVNCIAPGWIETKMTANLPEKSRDELLKRIPQARTGKPEDIAYTVLFLASDEANYITGQTITVDGGRVIN